MAAAVARVELIRVESRSRWPLICRAMRSIWSLPAPTGSRAAISPPATLSSASPMATSLRFDCALNR
jgi:hypothetical protein